MLLEGNLPSEMVQSELGIREIPLAPLAGWIWAAV